MDYSPGVDACPIAFNPFKSCTVPRPIGWLSTVSPEGVSNLAPYSQWQNLTFDPPMVMFAANQYPDGRRKDTVLNAERTGWFVWNMATFALKDAVNLSAIETGADTLEQRRVWTQLIASAFAVRGHGQAVRFELRPVGVADQDAGRLSRVSHRFHRCRVARDAVVVASRPVEMQIAHTLQGIAVGRVGTEVVEFIRVGVEVKQQRTHGLHVDVFPATVENHDESSVVLVDARCATGIARRVVVFRHGEGPPTKVGARSMASTSFSQRVPRVASAAGRGS